MTSYRVQHHWNISKHQTYSTTLYTCKHWKLYTFAQNTIFSWFSAQFCTNWSFDVKWMKERSHVFSFIRKTDTLNIFVQKKKIECDELMLGLWQPLNSTIEASNMFFFRNAKKNNAFVYFAHKIPCGKLLLIHIGFNVVTIFNLAFSWAFITKMICILQYFMKGERTKIMTQIENTAEMSCVAFYTQKCLQKNLWFEPFFVCVCVCCSLSVKCITFIIPNSRSYVFFLSSAVAVHFLCDLVWQC